MRVVKDKRACLGAYLSMQRVGLQAVALHKVEAVPELPVRQRVALHRRAVLKHLAAPHEGMSCMPHSLPMYLHTTKAQT